MFHLEYLKMDFRVPQDFYSYTISDVSVSTKSSTSLMY